MPESRQGKDGILQRSFTSVRAKGTKYVNTDRICQWIRAKELKFRTKKDNCAGIQLCDLLAHPSHMYVRKLMKHQVSLGEFAQKVAKILNDNKYDRSKMGKIIGYGVKHLP